MRETQYERRAMEAEESLKPKRAPAGDAEMSEDEARARLRLIEIEEEELRLGEEPDRSSDEYSLWNEMKKFTGKAYKATGGEIEGLPDFEGMTPEEQEATFQRLGEEGEVAFKEGVRDLPKMGVRATSKALLSAPEYIPGVTDYIEDLSPAKKALSDVVGYGTQGAFLGPAAKGVSALAKGVAGTKALGTATGIAGRSGLFGSAAGLQTLAETSDPGKAFESFLLGASVPAVLESVGHGLLWSGGKIASKLKAFSGRPEVLTPKDAVFAYDEFSKALTRNADDFKDVIKTTGHNKRLGKVLSKTKETLDDTVMNEKVIASNMMEKTQRALKTADDVQFAKTGKVGTSPDDIIFKPIKELEEEIGLQNEKIKGFILGEQKKADLLRKEYVALMPRKGQSVPPESMVERILKQKKIQTQLSKSQGKIAQAREKAVEMLHEEDVPVYKTVKKLIDKYAPTEGNISYYHLGKLSRQLKMMATEEAKGTAIKAYIGKIIAKTEPVLEGVAPIRRIANKRYHEYSLLKETTNKIFNAEIPYNKLKQFSKPEAVGGADRNILAKYFPDEEVFDLVRLYETSQDIVKGLQTATGGRGGGTGMVGTTFKALSGAGAAAGVIGLVGNFGLAGAITMGGLATALIGAGVAGPAIAATRLIRNPRFLAAINRPEYFAKLTTIGKILNQQEAKAALTRLFTEVLDNNPGLIRQAKKGVMTKIKPAKEESVDLNPWD